MYVFRTCVHAFLLLNVKKMTFCTWRLHDVHHMHTFMMCITGIPSWCVSHAYLHDVYHMHTFMMCITCILSGYSAVWLRFVASTLRAAVAQYWEFFLAYCALFSIIGFVHIARIRRNEDRKVWGCLCIFCMHYGRVSMYSSRWLKEKMFARCVLVCFLQCVHS